MSQYQWKAPDGAKIADHSRVKHRIYSDYLTNYVIERTARFGMDKFRLNVIDGFCGGGSYVTSQGDKVLGSPLVALQALNEAAVHINSNRTKPISFEFRLYCYDKNDDALDRLRAELIDAGYQDEIGRSVFLERAHFSQVARRVVDRLSHDSGRSVFLLDQYGYGAISFDTLRYIFAKLNQPEVILTFAYEWLTGFVGQYEKVAARFERLGLQPPPYSEYVEACAGRYGLPLFIQRQLIMEFRRVAKFFTPFFITSRSDGPFRGSNLKYWLVHLAEHERANDVMKMTHWGVHTHSAHFGKDGLEMLGYDAYKKGLAEQPHLFGESDEKRTHLALLEDMPRIIKPDAWVQVDTVWTATCNETTSTSRMQRDALRVLAEAKEIDVVGPGGGSKRGTTIAKGDLIRLPAQPSFYFMRSLNANPYPSSAPR